MCFSSLQIGVLYFSSHVGWHMLTWKKRDKKQMTPYLLGWKTYLSQKWMIVWCIHLSFSLGGTVYPHPIYLSLNLYAINWKMTGFKLLWETVTEANFDFRVSLAFTYFLFQSSNHWNSVLLWLLRENYETNRINWTHGMHPPPYLGIPMPCHNMHAFLRTSVVQVG